VGIVNELAFAPDFTKKFSTLNELSIVNYSDINTLIDAIKNKQVVAGLRLTGQSKYQQIKVELYYDNSP
ncbi:MAG: hypothetical protein NT033_01415, partial [Candidatus Omnitrophica bacterium]|nr:hypothetical protein [Candidatus Omnitrophota bacterium]